MASSARLVPTTGLVFVCGLALGACTLLFDSAAYRGSGPEPSAEQDAGSVDVVPGGETPDADVADGSTSEKPDGGQFGVDAGGRDAGGVDADAGVCSPNLQTDPLNCGRCARSCFEGACKAGVCQPFTLAKLTNDRWYMSGGTATLYLTGRSEPAGGMHSILAVKKANGAVTPIALERGSFGIRNTSEYVYWVSEEPPGQLRRAKKTFAEPPQSVGQLPDNERALEFALLGDTTAFVTSFNQVYRIDIATQQVQSIGTFPGAVGIESNSGTVYFVAKPKDRGTLFRIDNPNGVVKVVPVGEFDLVPRRLVLSKDAAFITGFKTGISRIARDGSTNQTLVRPQTEGSGWQGIALDDMFSYWSSADTVFRTPLSNFSGRAETLSTGEAEPIDIHVDSTAIYWINRGNGELRKLAK